MKAILKWCIRAIPIVVTFGAFFGLFYLISPERCYGFIVLLTLFTSFFLSFFLIVCIIGLMCGISMALSEYLLSKIKDLDNHKRRERIV